MFLRLARMSLACAAVVTVRPAIGASTDTLLGKAASGDAVYYVLLGDAGSVKTVQTRLV